MMTTVWIVQEFEVASGLPRQLRSTTLFATHADAKACFLLLMGNEGTTTEIREQYVNGATGLVPVLTAAEMARLDQAVTDAGAFDALDLIEKIRDRSAMLPLALQCRCPARNVLHEKTCPMSRP